MPHRQGHCLGAVGAQHDRIRRDDSIDCPSKKLSDGRQTELCLGILFPNLVAGTWHRAQQGHRRPYAQPSDGANMVNLLIPDEFRPAIISLLSLDGASLARIIRVLDEASSQGSS